MILPSSHVRAVKLQLHGRQVEASRRREGVAEAAARDKKRKAANLPQLKFRNKKRALYVAPVAEAAAAHAYRARRRVAEPPAAPEVVVEAAAAPAAEAAATAVVVQEAAEKKRKADENNKQRLVIGDCLGLLNPSADAHCHRCRPCAASAKASCKVAARQRASCARDSTALQDKDPKCLSHDDLELLEDYRRIHEMDNAANILIADL
eukprot:gene32053-16587_t